MANQGTHQHSHVLKDFKEAENAFTIILSKIFFQTFHLLPENKSRNTENVSLNQII